MASTRYGQRLYGTALYSGNLESEFVASEFQARATDYGRISVTWTRPGGVWTAQRLVRNLVGNPIDENDGEALLDQPTALAATSYTDSDKVVLAAGSQTALYDLSVFGTGRYGSEDPVSPPVGGTHYYYGLFVRDVATALWRRTGVAEVLATSDHGMTQRMYRRLPDVFKAPEYNAVGDLRDDEEQTFLYRFLSAFGFQLDHARTELESLRRVNNPRELSSTLLPALAQQLGVDYEPELGDRLMRRMTASALRLWGVRGTLAGVRELATVFTGWDSAVRLGHNLALDRLDAGPDGGVGRWTGRTNCTTSYEGFVPANRGPGGEGAVVITATAAGVCEVRPAPVTPNSRERLQYASPVIPNLPYMVSQYVRTTAPGVTAAVGLRWLNVEGNVVGAVNVGDPTNVVDSWTARPAHTALAPPTARYLEYHLVLNGLTAGATVRACALQIQEDYVLRPWAPAREVRLFLAANLVNYVGNTSGFGSSAEGWSKNVAAPLGFGGLTFESVVQSSQTAVALIDALTVTYAGDVAGSDNAKPVLPPYIATYEAETRLVEPRQPWSLLVDMATVNTMGFQTVEVGVAKFDGNAFIGYEFGEPKQIGSGLQTVRYEHTVPDQANYDRIQLVIRSSTTNLLWRNATMLQCLMIVARQFDGATPSLQSEYVWQGVPHRSPTHYYERRSSRVSRLNELVQDFIPHPAQYKLLFAQAVVDSPRASHGTDLDPDDSPLITVGARMRTRWTATVPVNRSLASRWNAFSNAVNNDLTLRFNVDKLNKMVGLRYNLLINDYAVGRELNVYWVSNENLSLVDAVTVESDLETYSVVQSETTPDTYAARQALYPTYIDTTRDDQPLGTAIMRVRDDFDRANSLTSLGRASLGSEWLIVRGVWGISNAQAYSDTAGDADLALQLVNSPSMHVTSSFRRLPLVATWQIVARSSADGTSHYALEVEPNGTVRLTRRVANVRSVMASTAAGVAVAGDSWTLRVETELGVTRVGASRNSAAEVLTLTDTAPLTGSLYAGMRVRTSEARTQPRWDTFIVSTRK